MVTVATFYVYKLTRDAEVFVGYGVSKQFKSRHADHVRTFESSCVSWELLFTKTLPSIQRAFELEAMVKRTFTNGRINIKGFTNESLPIEYYKNFLGLISSFDYDYVGVDLESRLLKYRFSNRTGIPVGELDMSIVRRLCGPEKDLASVYNDLVMYTRIKKAAMAKGLSFQDLLTLIDSQKQP